MSADARHRNRRYRPACDGVFELTNGATSCAWLRTYQPSSRVRDLAFPGEPDAPYQCEATSSPRGKTNNEEMIMKTLISALLALSVLAGIAAPAGAVDYNRNGDRDVGLSSPL